MKRLLIPTVLFMCVAFPTLAAAGRHSVPRYLTKESTVDMKSMNNICVGWVNLGPDEWKLHGYETKDEWTEVIGSLNAAFQSYLGANLPGRSLVAVKENGDENTPGSCELYIKFSNVYVDYDNYHLVLSIHFIEPKSNTEIAAVPVRPYYGNDWGLKNYLNMALKEVGTKIHVEVTGEPGKKK